MEGNSNIVPDDQKWLVAGGLQRSEGTQIALFEWR
jgi:hypothetical protein